MVNNIESRRISYIKSHSNLSHNQILSNLKDKNMGMNRQKGHDLIREVRHEHIRKDTYKNIPIKYRAKVEVSEIPQHPDKYRVTHLKDKKTGKDYFIVTNNLPPHISKIKTYHQQIKRLIQAGKDYDYDDYPKSENDLKIIGSEVHEYKGGLFTSYEDWQ